MKCFIYLNKFNFKKILLMILVIPNWLSANELSIIKYGYGMRGWNGYEYEKAQLHPKQWYLPNYPIVRFKSFEVANTNEQALNGLYLSLSIKKNNNNILATLSFKNEKSHPYFIRTTSLPYIPTENKEIASDIKLCRMLFFISTANISLDYLGSICDYRSSFEKDDWYKLSPHSEVHFQIKLNEYYYFMPNIKIYSIRTTDFTFVKQEWFIEQNINKKILSLIGDGNNPHQYHIPPHLPPIKNNYISESNQLIKFMDRFNFKGINSNNILMVKSNQVHIKIDGKKVKSLYYKD